MTRHSLRWRKFVPIDRDYPIYELVDGETILLDVTKTEDRLEIAFHEGAAGRVLDLATLEALVADVKVELVDKPR
jgi:hypothetical protein